MEEAVHIIKKQQEAISEIGKRNKKAQELIDKFCNGERGRDSVIFQALDLALDGVAGSNLETVLSAGTVVYRARVVKDDELTSDNGISMDANMNTSGFDEGNSMEAPLGAGQAGRNNIAGMSYLYLAGDSETACIEMKAVPKSIISLAEIEVKKDLKLFDMTIITKTMARAILKRSSDNTGQILLFFSCNSL